MPTTPRSLVGGRDEITALLALVRAAERGEGGVLVLRGEPGIGESALLEHVEHAALHQLCLPVLAQLDTLSAHLRPLDHAGDAQAAVRARAVLDKAQGHGGIHFAGHYLQDIDSQESALTSAIATVRHLAPESPRLENLVHS
ncbi:ATP-binding protein [Amycolatopsis umgeniensis]|uniref:Orc1-like AAA ATPase domain-containing protein n=1 Tax=Amycolatopsis umgeniensis TaxID=336628 RepID=A0A841BC62_9PSEU|nr:ATP-binding protein [Amycolatopsis umgeniensis]MBB5857596.1 hypothetical protein [Amycolatopsis umgeniensis]